MIYLVIVIVILCVLAVWHDRQRAAYIEEQTSTIGGLQRQVKGLRGDLLVEKSREENKVEEAVEEQREEVRKLRLKILARNEKREALDEEIKRLKQEKRKLLGQRFAVNLGPLWGDPWEGLEKEYIKQQAKTLKAPSYKTPKATHDTEKCDCRECVAIRSEEPHDATGLLKRYEVHAEGCECFRCRYAGGCRFPLIEVNPQDPRTRGAAEGNKKPIYYGGTMKPLSTIDQFTNPYVRALIKDELDPQEECSPAHAAIDECGCSLCKADKAFEGFAKSSLKDVKVTGSIQIHDGETPEVNEAKVNEDDSE